jgi:hypothetical protein
MAGGIGAAGPPAEGGASIGETKLRAVTKMQDYFVSRGILQA